jgi:hypothetical protein
MKCEKVVDGRPWGLWPVGMRLLAKFYLIVAYFYISDS